jgi:hypothetical protein
MTGFFSVIVDPKVNTANLIKHEKPGTRRPADQPDATQLNAKPAGTPGGAAGSNHKQ